MEFEIQECTSSNFPSDKKADRICKDIFNIVKSVLDTHNIQGEERNEIEEVLCESLYEITEYITELKTEIKELNKTQ